MAHALLRLLAILVTAMVPGWGMAQETRNLVVVELFTSQGCAACPPADALIGELAGREDVIALSLHVDYWDYIGWQDTFAQAAFTARQQGYGRAAGSAVVYTPQMIVSGADHVVGTRPMSVADLIQQHQTTTPTVALRLSRVGDGLQVQAEPLAPVDGAMHVQLVLYQPHHTVEIARGERAGTVSNHYNVVTSWQVLGTWDGAEPFETTVSPAPAAPHAVIVQQVEFGPILAAARLD